MARTGTGDLDLDNILGLLFFKVVERREEHLRRSPSRGCFGTHHPNYNPMTVACENNLREGRSHCQECLEYYEAKVWIENPDE